MITQCPHCMSLLESDQTQGNEVDCANCGQHFIAQPFSPEDMASENTVATAKPSSTKQRNLEIFDEQIRERQRIKREKEKKSTALVLERSERENKKKTDARIDNILMGKEDSIFQLANRSSYSKTAIIIGILAIVMGTIWGIITFINDNDTYEWPIGLILGGFTLFFYSFVLDIFTDIRWVLALISKRLKQE